MRSQRERVLQWYDQPSATGGISLAHQEARTGRCAGALGWLLLPHFSDAAAREQVSIAAHTLLV